MAAEQFDNGWVDAQRIAVLDKQIGDSHGYPSDDEMSALSRQVAEINSRGLEYAVKVSHEVQGIDYAAGVLPNIELTPQGLKVSPADPCSNAAFGLSPKKNR